MSKSAHFLELTAELEDLLLHLLLVFDRLQNDLQARQIDRLGDVILGADLESLHRGIDSGVSGENDHRDVGIGFLDLVQQIDARAVGQLEVDDCHVGNELRNGGPPGLDRVGRLDFVAPLLH